MIKLERDKIPGYTVSTQNNQLAAENPGNTCYVKDEAVIVPCPAPGAGLQL